MLKTFFYFIIFLFLTVFLFLELSKTKKNKSFFYSIYNGGLSANDRNQKERIYEFLKNMSPPPKEPVREEFDEGENSDEEIEGEETEEDS